MFNVTLEQGFLLRGGISHTETAAEIQNWNYYVQRSLYIENTLYTVSNVKVKMNDLQDLAPINEITVG